MSQSTHPGLAQNPYAAPVNDDPKPAAPTRLDLAGNGQRFLTLVLDYVGIIICSGLLGGLLGLGGFSPFEGDGGSWVGKLLVYILMGAYYVGFEAICGKTPGKMLVGTRVVTLTGGHPSFWQCLGRTCARFVPFEPFSFFGSSAVGWHDKWTDTRVVRSR